MNSYKLSRKWFDFCFENPEKIKPRHTALYFFAIEHCNRLGWKKKFGFPTTMAKEAIGIGSYNTYKKTLDDLVDWGFIKLVQKSQNQYSSNIIALSNFDKSSDKSLDKALINHDKKQCESSSSINKQGNKETKEQGNDGKPSNIPTLKEVKQYFKENGYKPKVAEKAYSIYNASVEDHPKRKYWRDSRDNLIKNWKLKMQSVWFKPENEIKQNGQSQFRSDAIHL